MPPEQARGGPLDARTNLFSFGTVRYEIAAGRRAFSPLQRGAIFTAILREPTDPRPVDFQHDIPYTPVGSLKVKI
jgi:eukaryotic-like serine/threonine-protein kinase